MDLQRISIAAALGLCLWQPGLALSQTPAAAPDPAQESPAPAAAQPAAPQPAAFNWMPNEKVEVKWGGLWREATIVEKNLGWYQVGYSKADREWVEPYRIRKVGSKEDNLGYCRPSPMRSTNDGPPKHKPGDPPSPTGKTDPPKLHSPKLHSPTPVAMTDDPAWKKVQYQGTPTLRLDAAPASWNLTPDPLDKTAFRLDPTFTALAGINGEDMVKTQTIVTPRQTANLAFLCHTSGMPGSTNVRLEKVDLQTARTVVWPMNGSTLLLDVSPDGKTALFRSDGFGAGTANLLEIWSLADAQPIKSALFAPFTGDWTTADIKGGFFVDATHFLVWNGQGDLTLWDATEPKPVYTTKMLAQSVPVLSAGGNQFALAVKDKILILQARTGRVLATLASPQQAAPLLSFSPSGGRLAALHAGHMKVWDLQTGLIVADFSLPMTISSVQLQVVDDSHALVNDQYLVNFDHRIVLWRYVLGGQGEVTVAPGGQLVYLIQDPYQKTASLGVVKLPHAPVQQAAQKLTPVDMLIKPGVKVSLQLDLPVSQEERANIQAALQAEMQAAGWELADHQPLVLHALVEQGKSREQEFRTIGAHAQVKTEKATITPQICKLLLKHAGTPAWKEQSTSDVQTMVPRREGQSLQAAIDDLCKPQTDFFKTVHLPRYLALPTAHLGLGVSTLTDRGITTSP